MIHQFEVGDRVILADDVFEKNSFYPPGKDNPTNCGGVISEVDSSYYYVKWDNGGYNSYNDGDLLREDEVMKQALFWMVVHNDTLYTKKRHYTFDSAYKEAQRLAVASPGNTFFVLQAVAKAVGSVSVQKTTFL